ncbi:MAG TPA: hypothetical protein VFX16_19165 [Pseudonocardiaceae bacterium]|nr:hypothetical protein [Pseudonocardiaceae bacterium]
MAGIELSTVTAASFRALLRNIMLAAGLTCGKVNAVIEHRYRPGTDPRAIGRSQVYSLLDSRRTSAPQSGVQVRTILHACKLPPDATKAVMALWHDLQRQPRLSDHDGGQDGDRDG